MNDVTSPGNALAEMRPAGRVRAVTPNNGTDLPYGPCDSVYVGTGGSVALIAELDTASVVFANVQDGSYLLVRAKRILSTGTTAQDIVALY